MKKYAVILLTVLFGVLLLVPDTWAEGQELNKKPLSELTSDVKEAVFNDIKNMREFDGVGEVEVDEKDRKCVMFVFAKPSIDDYSTKVMGTSSALTMVETLMANGRDPYEEHLWIRCSVAVRGKTATGRDGMRVLGAAHYDYNTDSIKWEWR